MKTGVTLIQPLQNSKDSYVDDWDTIPASIMDLQPLTTHVTDYFLVPLPSTDPEYLECVI